MIDRNQIIRRADADCVPAPTVERDYILSHVLAAVADCDQAERIAFKGGTALRLCYFEDYRYSADLDFSLIGGLDRPGALQAVAMALVACRQALELPQLSLTAATPPRIEYMGPLGRSRTLKLDLADDELVEDMTRRTVLRRYSDQGEGDCLAYTLEETAAEKLRCVIHASSAATSTTYTSCSSCAVSTRASSGRCSSARRDIASSIRASFRRDSRSGCRSTRPAGRTSSQTTWPVTPPRSLRSCSAPFAERSVTRCVGAEIARRRAAYDPPSL